ncbi:aldo/keto reductase family oxidoreductase, partial [Escherichia coli]
MDEEDIKMKQLQFGTSDETVSSVILGCMRLNG